jgi:hypothetical protein
MVDDQKNNIASPEKRHLSLGVKILCALGIVILALGMCLGAFMAFVLSVNWWAEKRAQAFCDGWT